jgi:hypothetical protein
MRVVGIGGGMSETERRRNVRFGSVAEVLCVHHTGALFHPHGQRMMDSPEEKDGVLEALFGIHGVSR